MAYDAFSPYAPGDEPQPQAQDSPWGDVQPQQSQFSPMPVNPWLQQLDDFQKRQQFESQMETDRVRSMAADLMTQPQRTRSQRWGESAQNFMDRIALPLAGVFGGPGAAQGIVDFLSDSDKARKERELKSQQQQDMRFKALDTYMRAREHWGRDKNDQFDQLMARAKLEDVRQQNYQIANARVQDMLAQQQQREMERRLNEEKLKLMQATSPHMINKMKYDASSAQYEAQGKEADANRKTKDAWWTDQQQEATLNEKRARAGQYSHKNDAQDQLAASRAATVGVKKAQENKYNTQAEESLSRQARLAMKDMAPAQQAAFRKHYFNLQKIAQENPEALAGRSVEQLAMMKAGVKERSDKKKTMQASYKNPY